MSNIALFLKEAFPNIDGRLIEAAAREFTAGGSDNPLDTVHESQELADAREEAARNREEIGRLNIEIVRHRDGIQHATVAGLEVLGERARQRRLEGYDDSHDDMHSDYSLSAAAIAYIMDARLKASTGAGFAKAPAEWPFSPEEWKPKAVRKSLVVAAALLLAEIERIDRRD